MQTKIIKTDLHFSLKMNENNIQDNITNPSEGCGGEAVGVSSVGSFLGTVEDQEKPADAGWFVAVVRCNCERKIAAAMEISCHSRNIWFEPWIPMQKIVCIDRRTGKRKSKEKTFIPTYIFCHISKKQLNEIRFRSDVYKMLTMPGQREIYQVPDAELNNYRILVENPEIPAVAYTGPLKKGQKVRITQGKLKGLEAYVQRLAGTKALIGNEIRYVSGATIEINRAFLELVTDEK